jgi:hypothetical protein
MVEDVDVSHEERELMTVRPTGVLLPGKRAGGTPGRRRYRWRRGDGAGVA